MPGLELVPTGKCCATVRVGEREKLAYYQFFRGTCALDRSETVQTEKCESVRALMGMWSLCVFTYGSERQ